MTGLTRMTKILSRHLRSWMKCKINSQTLRNTQRDTENMKKFSKSLSTPTLNILRRLSRSSLQGRKFLVASLNFKNMDNSGIRWKSCSSMLSKWLLSVISTWRIFSLLKGPWLTIKPSQHSRKSSWLLRMRFRSFLLWGVLIWNLQTLTKSKYFLTVRILLSWKTIKNLL